MISFPAHSYSFHLIDLLFVGQRRRWREDGENCSQVTVYQIFIYFQGYSSQNFNFDICTVLDGFFQKNLSFKIGMSGWAGVRRASGTFPRLTFWLTVFQRYKLPLFFNGLISYLVGMKRRTSRTWCSCP